MALGSVSKKLAQGATIVFIDEAGFGLVPVVGRTWGRLGETPILRHAWGPYARVSAISAITTNQRLLFQLKKGKTFRARDVARFLRLLLRELPGEIIVVLDGAPQHKSKAVRQVAEDAPRLELVFLPPYCPELNPDEKVWNHLKNVVLRGRTPVNIDGLSRDVTRGFARMKRRPDLLDALLRASELPWSPRLA